MLDEGTDTTTTKEQVALEKKILPFYQELEGMEPAEMAPYLQLNRQVHTAFLQGGLGQLNAGFAALDAGRPWICYWIVHSLALLNAPLPDGISADDVADFLACCQHPTGGFGGGPMQLAHLAPTYAAVCALVTLGTEYALSIIDRVALLEFLERMIIPSERGGGFSVHEGGECDLRACFCALAVAKMLALDIQSLVARSGVLAYIKRCQTHEGGLGGEPGNEAHGGYTFCGLAALVMAGRPDVLDLPRLVHWAVHRQGFIEGGFNGRTNKLVDGCYTTWQGGIFPLLQRCAPETLRQIGLPRPVQLLPPHLRPPGPLAPPPALPLHIPLEVPELPETSADTPAEVAEVMLTDAMRAYEDARRGGLEAADAATAAMKVKSARHCREENEAARTLMKQANDAHGVADMARAHSACVNAAACSLLPCPDLTQAEPEPAEGTAPPHGRPLLCNYKALQLWVLRCCQATKGGLRDKPGKQPDYYHTCYCLNGLAVVQHYSGYVLGPQSNLLRRPDPRVNVVEDKLQAAQAWCMRHTAERRPPASFWAAAAAAGAAGAAAAAGAAGAGSSEQAMDTD